MERIELIQKLMKEHTRSAAVTVSFLDKPRKYGMDNSLFMREVHFVVEIGPEGSPTMGELAQRLNVTQGAVTQMAIRLEKKGYVARAKDAGDKRVTTVSLTEKGRTLCAEHIAYDQSEFSYVSQFLKQYSEEELERLIEYEALMGKLFLTRT